MISAMHPHCIPFSFVGFLSIVAFSIVLYIVGLTRAFRNILEDIAVNRNKKEK